MLNFESEDAARQWCEQAQSFEEFMERAGLVAEWATEREIQSAAAEIRRMASTSN